MADTPAAEGTSSAGGGTFGFLSHKIAGKVPVWVVVVAAAGAYYWYTHYGPGASSSQAAKSGGASTIIVAGGAGDDGGGGGSGSGRPPTPKTGGGGQGSWKSITVPAAWNGWSLDQIAKYLHWTPQTKQDVLEANARGGKEITGSTRFHTGDELIRPIGAAKDFSAAPEETGSDAQHQGLTANPDVAATGNRTAAGQPTAAGVLGTYQLPPSSNPTGTVTGWEGQAINYLVGEGVPPDEASTSVFSYLHSEPLSSRMQANVNLATDGIGAPPGQPGPATKVRSVPQRNTPRKKKVAA